MPGRTRLVAARIAAICMLVLAGCSAGDDSEPRREARSPSFGQPVQMVKLAPAKRQHCAKSPFVRPACPRLVPRVRATFLSHLAPDLVSPPDGRVAAFGLERGGEDPRRPERNRPPLMAHIEILAGAVERGAAFEYPTRAVPLRDGILRRARTRALFFGPLTWGGRSGRLFLAPPYLHGGVLGNHLVFRWREDDTEYVLSLHAWEPLRETAATLKAMVESLPRAAGPRSASPGTSS